MTTAQPVKITLCMGSSCFSRGNNRNIELLCAMLQERPLHADVIGHLCEGECKTGPHVLIDGKMYHEVDPVTLAGLLNGLAGAKAKTP